MSSSSPSWSYTPPAKVLVLDDVLAKVGGGKPENRAWAVEGLMSAKECAQIVAKCDAGGFGELSHVSAAGYSRSYRDNWRIMFDDEALAATLFQRLQAAVGPEALTLALTREGGCAEAFGHHVEGDWKATGLNSRFRLCKYDEGGKFEPHCDGMYQASPDNRSFLTVMVYLNDAFEGGETTFIGSFGCNKRSDQKGSFLEQVQALRLAPGAALVFTQQTLLHSGAKVTSGFKYILRSDVMFTRTYSPNVQTEDQKRGLEALTAAHVAESEGDLTAAVRLYKQAFRLDPNLERG